jgi:chromosome segregation ATPase
VKLLDRIFVNMHILTFFIRERQQQLEELTKELARIQEECDALRMRLKASKSKVSNLTQ